MSGPDNVLSYMPPVRRWRWIIWLTTLLVLGGIAWYGVRRLGPPWWEQGKYLHAQRQCLNHTLPAGTVVVTIDPTEARSLVQDSRYRTPGVLFDDPWYPTPPADWHAPAVYTLPAFDRLLPPTRYTFAHGFLHERRTRGGRRALVLVRCGFTAFSPAGTKVNVSVLTYSPATWELGSKLSAQTRESFWFPPEFAWKGDPRVKQFRMLAGQADLNDESHFHIDLQVDGQPHRIDGWLEDQPGTNLGYRLKVKHTKPPSATWPTAPKPPSQPSAGS